MLMLRIASAGKAPLGAVNRAGVKPASGLAPDAGALQRFSDENRPTRSRP